MLSENSGLDAPEVFSTLVWDHAAGKDKSGVHLEEGGVFGSK